MYKPSSVFSCKRMASCLRHTVVYAQSHASQYNTWAPFSPPQHFIHHFHLYKPETSMDPFLESNVLKRMAHDMEVDDNELDLTTFCYLKCRRYRNQCGHGGFVPSRVRIARDHFGGHLRIVVDYFWVHLVYIDAQFQRRYICYIGCCVFVTHSIQPSHKILSCRFRMRRHVFECPVGTVQQVDSTSFNVLS